MDGPGTGSRPTPQHHVPVAFDLLSLDVDRNTSHLWRALSGLAPRIVVIEYNAAIPRDDAWEVAYRSDAPWDGSDTSWWDAS